MFIMCLPILNWFNIQFINFSAIITSKKRYQSNLENIFKTHFYTCTCNTNYNKIERLFLLHCDES